MLLPALEKLLIFQDRDQRRQAFETQIKQVPDEIAAVRRKIEEERAGVETAKAAWREAEAKRKALETEIGLAEQKAARFRTQQLEVRKNDEYQALGHEIETVAAQVAALEEKELVLLYEIDESKAKVKAAEAAAAQGIAVHEARIRTLQEKESTMRQALAALQGELEAARAAVPEAALAIYVRIAKRVPLPVCVPLRELRCSGCNLKVSSGISSDVRAGSKLVTCENCDRIVFCES
jgi:predicted  nucleic acid-binding Zn-ribbon protein